MIEKPSSDTNARPGPLAHWHFTAEQWKEFRYYENLDFENRSLVDEKTVLIGGMAVVVLLAIGASFTSTRIGGPGSLAASGFVFIAGSVFLGVCFLIYRLVRKIHEQKLNTLTGEVVITPIMVSINGSVFDWRGWSRPEITESYIHIGNEKMLLLHFQSMRWMQVRGGREKLEKIWLVPVPPGKESEARIAIAGILHPFETHNET